MGRNFERNLLRRNSMRSISDEIHSEVKHIFTIQLGNGT